MQTSVAILFVDVSGSTSLYETLGDQEAQRIIKMTLSQISDKVLQHQGTIIKTIGDAVMSTFPSADLAICAASEVQLYLQKFFQETPALPGLRIGVNYGPVILEGGDVFGDTVNVAARVLELAKPGQILATEQTVHNLLPALQLTIRRIDRMRIRGKKETVSLYEVVWQETSTESSLTNIKPPEPSDQESRLRLRFHDTVVEVHQDHPIVTLGRELGNSLVVENKLTSRQHASIEYSRGKFLLRDQSANGTFIETPQGIAHVHREELVLLGSGVIGLGYRPDEDIIDAIYFDDDQSAPVKASIL
jgi:class 3 adenylate cyclase